MKSIQGKLLVASPYLTDPSFLRSVVFVVTHTSDEAFGLILNRPTEYRLRDLIKDIPTAVREIPIFAGGPVEGPLMAVHDIPDFDQESGLEGLAVSVRQETILDLAARADIRMRVFDGYAGWGPGQLDQELEQGGWMVTDAYAERIFFDRDDLWETLVADIGREILTSKIGQEDLPVDPSLN